MLTPLVVDGQACLTNNNGFSRLFFPETLAREFDPFVFPAKKGSGTIRVVVLGESAAQGTPDGAYAFSRILSRLLESAYPELRFEVINTGMTAINSHAILPIAEAMSRYRPEAVVVYMGNNEVVGPYGAGTVFSQWTPHRGLIRAGLALRRYRLGQWLSDGLARPNPETLRGWGGMQMFVEHQVSADDPRLEGVYRHFEANLEAICRVSERAGARVLLCTVGSNLRDCPPFASGHKAGLTEGQMAEWKRLFEQGVELERKGQLAEAVAAFAAAWAIDDRHAETAFRLGRCAERGQDFAAAGPWYRRARQLDTLRFRADDRINEIVREKATGTNRMLVDTATILEQASPNGLTGRELFYEHVHLTFSGNFVVARTIFESLGKRLPGLKDKRTGSILTEAQCAESLAFTPYDQFRIADEILNQNLVKPPFTAQAYHAEQVAELNKEFEILKSVKTPESLAACSAAYQRAIEAHPGDGFLNWKYGRLLAEEMADYAAAERQYALVQLRLPLFHRALTARGQMLAQLGNNQEAIRQFVRAIELQPNNYDPHYQLARVFHKQGHAFEAIAEYRKTLHYRPGYAPVYNPLAELLQKRGQVDEAIAVCIEGTSANPQDAILFCNLGVLLDTAGRPKDAIQAFKRAMELAPDSADIRRVAETVLRRRGIPMPR
ncbi:MAG: tetratricopeptide repeat protein [Phycisphaerae bacterium]|nr:tetratricopeptide repeat protein [Phycisphaerae bacterium]